MKPDNIMVVNDDDVKIIDFNVAVYVSKGEKITGGTGLKEWSAPETRHSLSYDEKCDFWSLGMLFVFLQTDFYPLEENSFEENRELALQKIGSEQAKYVDLVKKLLETKPENRLTEIDSSLFV